MHTSSVDTEEEKRERRGEVKGWDHVRKEEKLEREKWRVKGRY